MAPIIIHGLRLFCLFYKNHMVFNVTMHYIHSGTTSLYQVLCLNVIPLMSYAFQVEVVSEDEQFTK